MWSGVFLTLLVAVCMLEGTILFRRQSKKCEAVVMCPQFCLKIKDGCYVCECGASMNTFMEGAIQQMKHDYDPIYQTGSKFVNVNMGTNGALSGRKTDTRKSPWLNMGMGMGTFGATPFGGPMMGGTSAVSQAGNYLEPDFKEFYRPAGQTLPGRCPEMDYACPGQCWKTDGFSGCFRCDCGGTTQQSTSLRTTTPGSTQTERRSTTVHTTTQPPTTPTVTSTVSSSQITTAQKMTSGTQKVTSDSVHENNVNGNIDENRDKNGTLAKSKPDGNPSGRLYVNGHVATNSGSGDGTLLQSGTWSNTGNGTGAIETGHNGTGLIGTPFTVSQSEVSKSLADLNGVDLFKILIAGIKEHKSLEDMLYSLAHTADQGHQATEGHQNFAGQAQSGNSKGSNVNVTTNGHQDGEKGVTKFQKLEITSSPLMTNSTITSENTKTRPYEVITTSSKPPSKSTPEPSITKILGIDKFVSMNGKTGKDEAHDCLDIGSTCPLECHVTDPVSHCSVCGCPDNRKDLNHLNSKCVAMDSSCPGDCITLDNDLCPVCACSHGQMDNGTTPSPVVTQETNTTLRNTICKITEKIRKCASSCLTFDDQFCPQCACSADSSTETIVKDVQPSLDENNICPASASTFSLSCICFYFQFALR
ncbi:mucin-16-like isoform X4 [Ostrea edulis]|uniref:mucin-16-like isoform X4 n=1 Tax=Ostrea edulis TaxID=37623 RepID=UPI0024AF17AC|nr:mucin-16-like isoform X4 [Ostrea edulis]